MNAALLLLMISLVGIAFAVGNHDFLSPWFVLCTMFLACLIVTLLNAERWDVRFHFQGIVFILCGVLSWGIGSLCAKSTHKLVKASPKKSYRITYSPHLIAIVSLSITIIYGFKLVQLVPFQMGFTAWLRRVYEVIVAGGNVGFIGNQLFIINEILACISIYIWISKISRNIWILVPVISFGICSLLSTDRNTFIQFIIYCLCLWILLFKKTHKINVNYKVIKRIAIVLLFGVIVFFIFGKAKMYQSNFWDSVSIYTGSGIYAFDMHLQNMNEGGLLYGKETFHAILGVLNRIGLTNIDWSEYRFSEFISYRTSNGYFFSTNAYTALKRYVDDFGFWGVIVLPFLTGFMYEAFYRCINKNKSPLGYILFSMYFYPIIYYPIMERLFTKMNLGIMYEIIWTIIIYHCIFHSTILEHNKVRD